MGLSDSSMPILSLLYGPGYRGHTWHYDANFAYMVCAVVLDRLVGLVVKASASTAGGPGFESR